MSVEQEVGGSSPPNCTIAAELLRTLSILLTSQTDPHWEWQKEPEVRQAVRPQVAALARVATFLASEGRALNAPCLCAVH